MTNLETLATHNREAAVMVLRELSDESTVVQQVSKLIELAEADPEFVEREGLVY